MIIPSRLKFLNRKQTEGEGMSTYIAELRALAMDCDYDKDVLNIMLRDLFVSGLRVKMILDGLFEEDNINLEKTLNIALAMEKAFKGANDIMGRGDCILHEEEPKRPPIMINLKIQNKSCSMELERVRTVPFALKGRVEIDRLEREGIIEKVDSSEWANPDVPVVKTDGSIRLCADYSVTLNPNLIVPQHPLPRLEEIFGSLNGGKQFTKLDLKHAYLQMKAYPDTSDASPVGIGCVLSQVYPDGSVRPITFASRTLSGPEKNTPKLIKKLFQ
ncbi:retrovirus-related Pol polyprotein from transposon 412 [Trichonephila clavipes]|nr:retrovirus-related Pol polyprotein from transposon 412 [Trichonephila clavipes]